MADAPFLVGGLEACLMARRGYEVIYMNFRDDIRLMEHVPGRSINLAMSIRGRTGLRDIGVEEKIIRDHGIPMRGRMIHGTDGSMKPIFYNKDGKCIYSVGRRHVNEVLLSRAEEFPNVEVHFKHKLINVDLDSGKMTFEITDTKETVTRRADLVIGCDGAYSSVRKQMLKRPHFNYQQEYIPHGYMELCIPPTSDGKGMEDCVVLDDLLNQYNDDFNKVLPLYTKTRNPDAEAIVDLAMYNYVEMRDLVNSRFFLLRKVLDNFLYTFLPNTWIPLYTMVTFTRERYHMCILKKKWQDKVIRKAVLGFGIFSTIAITFLITKIFRSQDLFKSVNQLLSSREKLLF
ncbi:Kynurenine 3-monooxygenase [Armadillidium vulgare]|nr:Kynurenine 3-monooxygenase [Armadillidium vulgare]